MGSRFSHLEPIDAGQEHPQKQPPIVAIAGEKDAVALAVIDILDRAGPTFAKMDIEQVH
jgi:hypothetical protein